MGAALLLALDHHGDGQRQRAGHGLEGAAGLDEGHHLTFVVAGTARDDGLASVRQCRDARRERRRLPEIERVDRLHIVMAVEQNARTRMPVAVLPTTTGWPAVGRTLGVRSRCSTIPSRRNRAAARQSFLKGGSVEIDWIFRKSNRPIQTLVQIGVDLVEDGGQCVAGVIFAVDWRVRAERSGS